MNKLYRLAQQKGLYILHVAHKYYAIDKEGKPVIADFANKDVYRGLEYKEFKRRIRDATISLCFRLYFCFNSSMYYGVYNRASYSSYCKFNYIYPNTYFCTNRVQENGEMSYWNMRIMKYEDDSYGLHEVHYTNDGRIIAWTQEPVKVVGTDKEDLLRYMELVKEDIERFKNKVLDYNMEPEASFEEEEE